MAPIVIDPGCYLQRTILTDMPSLYSVRAPCHGYISAIILAAKIDRRHYHSQCRPPVPQTGELPNRAPTRASRQFFQPVGFHSRKVAASHGHSSNPDFSHRKGGRGPERIAARARISPGRSDRLIDPPRACGRSADSIAPRSCRRREEGSASKAARAPAAAEAAASSSGTSTVRSAVSRSTVTTTVSPGRLPSRSRIAFSMPRHRPPPIDTIEPVYSMPSKVARAGIRPRHRAPLPRRRVPQGTRRRPARSRSRPRIAAYAQRNHRTRDHRRFDGKLSANHAGLDESGFDMVATWVVGGATIRPRQSRHVVLTIVNRPRTPGFQSFTDKAPIRPPAAAFRPVSPNRPRSRECHRRSTATAQ